MTMRYRGGWWVLMLGIFSIACEEPPAANPVVEPAPSALAAATASSALAAATASSALAVTATANAAATKAGQACGELGCRHFDSPQAAFKAVLASQPRVLAIGEAHAQRGSEGVTSATARFREQLLPLVKGQASDLVIELMVADNSCRKTQQKVAKLQKPVTRRQASNNQNEFTALGHAANDLGIRPHVLRPSCEDYQEVVEAGADGIPAMLTMIAKLSESLLTRILLRNRQAKRDELVLAYGGAMHNDVTPASGRESWSFGPAMTADKGHRYIALDLIVPEFIKDNDSWRKLAWYSYFDAQRAPDKVTLFRTGPASYTMIFARTPKAPAAAQP